MQATALGAGADAHEKAAMVPCWSCHGPVRAGDAFCGSCQAVQPPGQVDHFRRLGLPRAYVIDLGVLEKAYFQAQRQLHPDRFATRTAKEKALSQQQATALNDAYETLKDSLSRATYLAGLMGLNVLKEGCNALTDPVILMEAMEMREALAEAETEADVTQVTKRAQDEIADCEDEMKAAFAKGDLEALGTLLTRLKYLRKLADQTRLRRAELRGRA